ncbi:RES family NAD+ phosphorylase [Cesiribacter sp. SM1]|uniref:RES family NAD+ phosphorylase n=1 Tax=Cesiribacter sp. SM1 TaxID=2861196 RepID=UPI001CD205E9|nr:RES family NAD+ phosphorylase [Cesiribacter sp. SM1]
MFVYRITRERWARDLSGFGAEKYPGRWNLPDFRMLYTAGSESLATLEVLAHFDDEEAPSDQLVVVLEFPDSLIEVLDPLPEGWDITPAGLASKHAGTTFLKEQQNLVLKVPSAIIKSEFNYLINPLHAEMGKVSIYKTYPKFWDERIIKK